MKIFNCIFGVLSIIAASYCIFYPGMTFINSGWIVTILLGVWGVCTIIGYTANSKNDEKSKGDAAVGVLSFIGGIAAAVISVLALFMPSIRIMLDIIILCVFSSWLMLSGITSVIVSFKMKNTGSKRWILTLICGVVMTLSGIYGIFNLFFVMQTIGILIGILLMIYGVRLVVSVFEKNG